MNFQFFLRLLDRLGVASSKVERRPAQDPEQSRGAIFNFQKKPRLTEERAGIVPIVVALIVGIIILALGFSTTDFAYHRDPVLAKATGFTDGKTYTAKATAYIPGITKPIPDHTRILKEEGGPNDRFSQDLRTLQDYLDGRADYVSVAMDTHVYDQYPYDRAKKLGWQIRIPELDAAYRSSNRSGKDYIIFRLVDTGGAFIDGGFGKVDICVRRGIPTPVRTLDQALIRELKKYTYEPAVNGNVTLVFDKNPPGYVGPPATPTAPATGAAPSGTGTTGGGGTGRPAN